MLNHSCVSCKGSRIFNTQELERGTYYSILPTNLNIPIEKLIYLTFMDTLSLCVSMFYLQ